MLDIVRKTCEAGEKTEFRFHATSVSYCVKNFTQGEILICLGKWDETQSVKLMPGTGEQIRSNPDPERGMTRSATADVIICAQITGEVEVQRDD